ncbi:MAG: hypothetical protein ACOY82_07760 [Pseudomonadota bacterium]
MKRALLLAIGWTMLGLGVVTMLICGLALIDPAGMQAANDADPLGAPPSTQPLLRGLVAAFAMKVCGVALVALASRDDAPPGGARTSLRSRWSRKPGR